MLLSTKDGHTDFKYQGETYQTYYKVFGDLSTKACTPLVVLHGGPGLTHEYVSPIAALHSKYDIPVILYDQLGNGRSTHLREKPPTFWTVDLFIDELINLLKHLSIEEDFSLCGHSWGGILAVEFELRRQPKGLKYLILSDSLAASSLWNRSNMELMQAFPKDVQDGLKVGMKDPPKFFAALLKYHAVHGCTIQPFPEEYMQTFTQVFGEGGDPTVASAPILNDWSSIDRLHLVRVPALVINGRKDISQDFVVKPFFDHISKVKWVTLENSSHMPFFEEPEKYFKILAEFVKLD